MESMSGNMHNANPVCLLLLRTHSASVAHTCCTNASGTSASRASGSFSRGAPWLASGIRVMASIRVNHFIHRKLRWMKWFTRIPDANQGAPRGPRQTDRGGRHGTVSGPRDCSFHMEETSIWCYGGGGERGGTGARRGDLGLPTKVLYDLGVAPESGMLERNGTLHSVIIPPRETSTDGPDPPPRSVSQAGPNFHPPRRGHRQAPDPPKLKQELKFNDRIEGDLRTTWKMASCAIVASTHVVALVRPTVATAHAFASGGRGTDQLEQYLANFVALASQLGNA